MTARLFLLLLLPLWPASAGLAGTQSLAPDDVAAIDAMFAPQSRPDAPGCGVGVYRAGELVFARGYGMASIEHAGPITPQTPFNIASLSKQFTGYAVQQLAREGKLDLDADIRRYLPRFPDVGAPVTARHLLHHTSGLRAYEALYTLLGWNRDHPLSRRQALDIIHRHRSTGFAPGTEHQYGNTNYVLLVEIVEAVDGRPLERYLAEEVFAPLGMAHTQLRTDPLAVIPGRAETYWVTDGTPRRNHVWAFAHATGASNVITTLEDLARWDAEFYTERVGGAGMVEAMYAPGVLASGASTDYGSGIHAGTYRGTRVVGHTGGAGGDYAFYRFPDHALAAAVLCNFEGANAADRAFEILELLLGDALGPMDDVAADAGAAPAERPVTAPWLPEAHALALYAGIYRSEELDVAWTFLVQGDALVALRPGFADTALVPVAPGKFQLEIPFDDGTWRVDLAFDTTQTPGSLIVTTHRAANLRFSRIAGPRGAAGIRLHAAGIGPGHSDPLRVMPLSRVSSRRA